MNSNRRSNERISGKEKIEHENRFFLSNFECNRNETEKQLIHEYIWLIQIDLKLCVLCVWVYVSKWKISLENIFETPIVYDMCQPRTTHEHKRRAHAGFTENFLTCKTCKTDWYTGAQNQHIQWFTIERYGPCSVCCWCLC